LPESSCPTLCLTLALHESTFFLGEGMLEGSNCSGCCSGCLCRFLALSTVGSMPGSTAGSEAVRVLGLFEAHLHTTHTPIPPCPPPTPVVQLSVSVFVTASHLVARQFLFPTTSNHPTHCLSVKSFWVWTTLFLPPAHWPSSHGPSSSWSGLVWQDPLCEPGQLSGRTSTCHTSTSLPQKLMTMP
jgi:hypothetical protein